MRFVRADRVHQIYNARALAFMLGYASAAKYLRANGWSVEAALWILLGKD